MIPSGYVAALVTYADVMGALGAQQVRDEWQSLFERMNAEGGLAVVNSTLSGKTFGFQVNMTLEEKFTAFSEALREINGTTATSTRACFPNINR